MEKTSPYEALRAGFSWDIPPIFNIGVDVCDKWCGLGKGEDTALIHISPDMAVTRRYTFSSLRVLSNKLANLLLAHGIGPGRRVGILLPQCPETLVSHIAVYKVGGVALPLLTLFGEMALQFRLSDSRASAVITDMENLPKVLAVADKLEHLKQILVTDGNEKGCLNWDSGLEKASADFVPAPTRPDDPALIIYTSGTTGPPKGTLHGHRILPGILPGFEFFHNLFPKKDDLMYTPLDWAYIGGSYDALFPALHHGVCVLAFRPKKFDPERAVWAMGKHRVKNLMAVPTVLRLIKASVDNPKERHGVFLRSVTVGGEVLGDELCNWSPKALGAPINEHYGQTECDMVIGGCAAVTPPKKGYMGKAVPGHQVEIIDDGGNVLGPGQTGEIAVKRPDPVMFLEYLNQPEKTAEKFVGNWFKTGDYGQKDDQGNFRFEGRRDDIIESGGFRIGPGEIEECLMGHPAVSLVCVLGVDDKTRGQIVKAFIVPEKGTAADEGLKASIQEHVRHHLEAHAYPRQIQFLDQMPMTVSGKIKKEELRHLHQLQAAGKTE